MAASISSISAAANDRLVIQNIGIGAGDIFNGGTGNDTIDYSNVSFAAGTGVVIDLLDGNIRNGIGAIESILDFENAIGSAGVETIEGTNSGNFLDGREGDDTIFGHDGNDTIVGGAGPTASTGALAPAILQIIPAATAPSRSASLSSSRGRERAG